jgi:hypothetical protein
MWLLSPCSVASREEVTLLFTGRKNESLTKAKESRQAEQFRVSERVGGGIARLLVQG